MANPVLRDALPELAAQWNEFRNGDLGPADVTTGSGRKVWWNGACGHEWAATVASRARGAGCPYCSPVGRKRLLVGFNDLATINPDLARQWHPTKNKGTTPEDVTARSHSRAWWVCSEDPRHEWEATVKDRAFGYGCPFCSNQRVLAGYNDLATVHPHLVDEWHPTKNVGLAPSEVAPAGKTRIWWLCHADPRHEWQATSGDRLRGYGCPYCSGNAVLAGYNDLATTHPDIAAEWHPTKNGKRKPSEVSKGSMTKYWWLCPLGHEYSQLPNSRTHGRGCPYCSNRRVLMGFNDLATVAPAVAAEWHPKNKNTPDRILSGSHSKAWWICKEGHEWRAQIKSRRDGRNCPYCRKPWSLAEKEVYAFVVEHAPGVEVLENDSSLFTLGMELDIFVPELALGIEFNGEYWHDESRDPRIRTRHERKQTVCESNSIRLVIVWESDWLERPGEVEAELRKILRGAPVPGWMTYART
ncbi:MULTISPECIES: zinc-ribbon domain-containing protein [unclassified Corynebacterium]|uniref:zinc-ribbon domain-containing protein n=1 Tax=unclassified Corynebacterium TaxID=2624378 RepID=UPI0009F7430B|nr:MULTISPECIES: zinc-ribbon domain-containing protein [unclassified Corynebacterium]